MGLTLKQLSYMTEQTIFRTTDKQNYPIFYFPFRKLRFGCYHVTNKCKHFVKIIIFFFNKQTATRFGPYWPTSGSTQLYETIFQLFYDRSVGRYRRKESCLPILSCQAIAYLRTDVSKVSAVSETLTASKLQGVISQKVTTSKSTLIHQYKSYSLTQCHALCL